MDTKCYIKHIFFAYYIYIYRLNVKFPDFPQGAVKQISGSVGNAVDCVEMQPGPWIFRTNQHVENPRRFVFPAGWEVVRSTSMAIKAQLGRNIRLTYCGNCYWTVTEIFVDFEEWNFWRFGFDRDDRDVCLNVLDWFCWFFVDLCPGGFQHKSWRLHHDEIILAVAQEERDSLGSSRVYRVYFCHCVRLVIRRYQPSTQIQAALGMR